MKKLIVLFLMVLMSVSLVGCYKTGYKEIDGVFNEILKDPKSLEIVEVITFPPAISGGNYTVIVKYRAKNSFGAYVGPNKISFRMKTNPNPELLFGFGNSDFIVKIDFEED